MKKILYICSVQLFPIQTGGAQVIHQYLKELTKENKVILITVKANDDKSKRAAVKNKNIKIYDVLNKNSVKKFVFPYTYYKINSLINRYRPNLIIMDLPWFGLIGIIAKFLFKIPFYIRSHNIEYLRMKRLNKRFWFILKIYEKIVYKYAEKIICISELDKKTLERELNVSPKKIEVSEYYPDPKIFKENIKARKMIRKLLNIEDKFVVLFFGSLDYQPNIEAVEIIRNKIAPAVLKQNKCIKFLIVGRNLNNLKSPGNIIFTGYVEKIEDYINASDLVIVPIQVGGGIRTKIIESIACGKTVISTNLGAEGIDKKVCQDKLIITDNWFEFTDQIIRLINQPKKNYVPKGFIKEYNWPKIIDNLKLSPN